MPPLTGLWQVWYVTAELPTLTHIDLIAMGAMGFLQEPTVHLVRQNTCLHSGILQKPQAPMLIALSKMGAEVFH